MLIANPIYDVVFRYMMKDNKVAKLLLSAIIGEEIEELEFKPTEVPVPISQAITVLRMDFKASVRYADGSRQIIVIELQKARVASDIIRFRRYLGEQYISNENTVLIDTIGEDADKQDIREAIPILSIYFLGHKLPDLKATPVVKVARQYTDLATAELIEGKSEFIECLTHDSYVIQIPYIKGHRRTDLERLLHIFDQTQVKMIDGKRHFLEVEEDSIPKRYQSVYKRLLNAYASAEVKHQMYSEDELLGDLRFMGKKIKVLTQTIRVGVLNLLKTGMSVIEIAEIFQITEAEVLQIKAQAR